MEFGRVKTILIAVFILLNVFLVYQWWSLRSASSIIYSEPVSDQLANVQGTLAAHGMRVSASVPSMQPRMAVLRVTYATIPLAAAAQSFFGFSREAAAKLRAQVSLQVPGQGYLILDGPGRIRGGYTLAQSGKPGLHSQYLQGLEQSLQARLYRSGQYKLAEETLTPSGGTAVYDQTFDGLPIFCAPLKVAGNGSRVRFDQTAVQVLGEGREHTVISAIGALLSLSQYMDKIQLYEDNTIEDIRLGYDASIRTRGVWFAAPVWRIRTRLGVFSVNAFTGEVGAGTQ